MYLQAIVVKSVLLMSCLLASAVAVYPEAYFQRLPHHRDARRPATSVDTPLITEEMVNGWVGRWQQRLGMEDWKIETKIVRLNQFPKGTIANIHWSLPRRTATIKVLDPIDSTLAEVRDRSRYRVVGGPRAGSPEHGEAAARFEQHGSGRRDGEEALEALLALDKAEAQSNAYRVLVTFESVLGLSGQAFCSARCAANNCAGTMYGIGV